MMPSTEQIQRRLVWSGWLRLAHWGMGFSVLVLLATGWLIKYTRSVYDAALDYHYISGSILAMSLLLRLGLLLFDKTTGQWRALIPRPSQFKAMGEMLRFYLSFAKMPLPKWYAHNPLWAPVYALSLIVMGLLVLSGYFMDEQPFFAGFYLPDTHSFTASLMGFFVILHVISVFLHDLRGTGSDISAIISGYRIFVIAKLQDLPNMAKPSITLDEIMKTRASPDQEKQANTDQHNK